MKRIFFAALITISMHSLAHDGGHGEVDIWIIDSKPVIAELVTYDAGVVHFVDAHHKAFTCDLSRLSARDQELIKHRNEQIRMFNADLQHHSTSLSSSVLRKSIQSFSVLLMVFLLIMLRRKRNHYMIGFMISGLLAMFIMSCGDDDMVQFDSGGLLLDGEDQPANDIAFLTSLFDNFSSLSTSSDDDWFYISGNGLPEHDMMKGITNWQQQVPIDQDFTGDNSWQIPIQPVVAESPQPMEDEFFRNAIAISVNGVPLYHPMTNAGVDAFASGQLDQWGGHSGRADDYHYHLPPTHLEAIVGSGNPIAYALDGFPIYGETTETLDASLGRYNADGGYQYHTIPNYPYFMANLVGEVNLTETQDGQSTVYEITPQPRTTGARPSTDPLGGALEITDFETTGTNSYLLTYVLDGETYLIDYSWDEQGVYTYTFTLPDGSTTTETYQRTE